MTNVTVYGLPNCDITRLAIAWLKKNKIEFNFHDYKRSGINAKKLHEWSGKTSWENLLNKRGTTWKKISPQIQQSISDQQAAIELMQEFSSLIKRPVVEINDQLLIGFNEAAYHDQLLQPKRVS